MYNKLNNNNFIIIMVIVSVCPRINENGRGRGDVAGTQSVKVYLGAWCMYIYHILYRYAETDSELFLIDLCCYIWPL